MNTKSCELLKGKKMKKHVHKRLEGALYFNQSQCSTPQLAIVDYSDDGLNALMYCTYMIYPCHVLHSTSLWYGVH